MIFKEIPPTAGFPLRFNEITSAFNPSGKGSALEEDFRKYLGVSCAKVTYSGTAALYFILETLKNISAKRTVVIPSYICTLIPLAIKKAELKIEVCDINRDDFNFEMDALQKICSENDDILAVLATHLGGIPIDLDGIKSITARYGIFIIEDCAQSLGAQYKGIRVGTLGDFSFFSLCRGKGLTIYEGGVAVTAKKEYAEELTRMIERLEANDPVSEAVKIIEIVGYWFFYRPLLFWYVYRLPQIFWIISGKRFKAEKEYFGDDIPVHKVSAFRKAVGHVMFGRLEEEIVKQREKASYYIKNLESVKGIRMIKESPNCRATYPYVALIFNDKEKRQNALKAFFHSGPGVSNLYSQSIIDYPYIKYLNGDKDCPNGRRMAANNISLSTNTFIDKKDMDSVVRMIRNL